MRQLSIALICIVLAGCSGATQVAQDDPGTAAPAVASSEPVVEIDERALEVEQQSDEQPQLLTSEMGRLLLDGLNEGQLAIVEGIFAPIEISQAIELAHEPEQRWLDYSERVRTCYCLLLEFQVAPNDDPMRAAAYSNVMQISVNRFVKTGGLSRGIEILDAMAFLRQDQAVTDEVERMIAKGRQQAANPSPEQITRLFSAAWVADDQATIAYAGNTGMPREQLEDFAWQHCTQLKTEVFFKDAGLRYTAGHLGTTDIELPVSSQEFMDKIEVIDDQHFAFRKGDGWLVFRSKD